MSRRLPWWVVATSVAVYVFLHLPLLTLVAFSFNDSKYSVEWKGFTTQWYTVLLDEEDPKATAIREALRLSLEVGITSTLISTILGTWMALALARHRFPGRQLVEALLYVPIVTPEIVVGISLLILFTLGNVPLGFGTIVIAHVAFNISFVVVVVHARLQGMDQSLEEAALILGADEVTAFWRVTVPQLWPGILAGALLAFTMSFDDFVITSFVTGVGGSTLPIVVYGMVRKNIEPTINAISTIILLVTTVLLLLSQWFGREKRLVKD